MKTSIIFKFFLILTFPLYLTAGGICLYEISTADVRLASAGWSARAQDPSTLFTNPAGMSRLCGDQAEFGLQPIYANVHFKPNAETTIAGSPGNADVWLPSGSFFYVHPCNESLTVGIGSLGYFGADLDFNRNWVGRYYVQKTFLEGLSLVPAASYQINDQWSVGVGANIMYSFLKQRTAVRNFLDPLGDGYLRLDDNKFGVGGLVGILYEPTCGTRFGIQYLSPVRLNFKARPEFYNVGPLLSDVLVATGIAESKVNMYINVPQSVMFSAYHELTPEIAVMGNAGWQNWSNFQKVTINLADIDQRSITSKVNYQDTWHVALGTEWNYCDNLTLSGGIAYDSSAISNKNRTLDFPVGAQWRFGTGARWYYSETLFFDFSSELQWQGNLKADVDKPIVGHISGTFPDVYGIFISTNVTWVF